MTAQPVSPPVARNGANLVGLPCGRDDDLESVAAVVVLAARGTTRIAVVDLLRYPCGQHHLDDIVSATNEPGVVELVEAHTAALDLLRSLTGPHRPAVAMAPPIASGDRLPVHNLSARELDVLELISAGLTNPEIAARLYLSINTIKTYIRTSYRKIGVKRRSQAVSWGLRHGLESRPEV